uniref:Transcription factor E n=1 Tax=Thermofilum pendens TaxID=2269 RepID=A0A7C1P0Q6_THEPE
MKREEVLIALARKIHGEDAARIMRILMDKAELSDEELASELGMDVARVRRILNELFESRFVRYRRARDENVGWYRYYWRITDEPPERIIEDRKRLVAQLLEKLFLEETRDEYYMCPACGRKYTSAEADELGYLCAKCEEVLEPYDNTVRVEKLKTTLELLKSATAKRETPP